MTNILFHENTHSELIRQLEELSEELERYLRTPNMKENHDGKDVHQKNT